MRSAIQDWFSSLGSGAVRLNHNDSPKADPDSRYQVVYEAVFEPSSLEISRVELWLTQYGEIAVGFETRERIARRLGVKNRRSGFAAGHEPSRISEEALLALLDVVASGAIAIRVGVVPILGLIKTKAEISRRDLHAFADRSNESMGWLRVTSERQHKKNVVRFRPWR